MKKIKLTQGKYALVDNEDYEWLSQWSWYFAKHCHQGYAQRSNWRKAPIIMHRAILEYYYPNKKYFVTDHKNGNKLDNRKINIRLCTPSQNSFNRGKSESNTSGYKGIFWSKRNKSWQVRISVNNKRIFVGYFKEKIEAALAYNKAASQYHKEFARLNQVGQAVI